MAPREPHRSSRIGRDDGADTLASCYVVDASGGLRGLHYCTTPAAGAEWEECERFFCDALAAAFRGERNAAAPAVGLSARVPFTPFAAHRPIPNTNADIFAGQLTPPGEHELALLEGRPAFGDDPPDLSAWLEVYDFVGGTSFRAFVARGPDAATTLFVFFDATMVSGDLKPALMALIELAESPLLACSGLVVCLDRRLSVADARSLTRSLQWVGFEMATLDAWGPPGFGNITSDRWLLMSMEL